MRRVRSAPREGWAEKVEEHGLAFHRTAHPEHLTRPYWDESVHYVFDMDEVLALEAVVEELHRMCLDVVEHVVSTGRYHVLGIPDWVAPLIEESWRRGDPHLYGRFDLRYDGQGPAKLLEYNADTPTALVESAVVQWYWLQETHPGDDQWNSIHERFVARWKEMAPTVGGGPVHFAWTTGDETGEEVMTIAYMQETAEEAGLPGVAIAMEDIGWDAERRRFVDLDEREIGTLCKLYPWEWIVAEPFGRNIPGTPTSWIEPIWKMVLSNKALLVLLWELFPGHPNLLPTYLNTPSNLTSYVQKPLLGREGASMRIVTPDGSEQRTQGDYGAEGFVFQEFCALPEFDGEHPVLGAWVVHDGAAGIGIRETSGLITDDTSSFVPHRIPL
ncbi:glutathionylspermidine synthase family protein [Actinomadura sp. NPDC048955]|uniref:Glutathionylspermidine synthase n=1 Tax=Actinomadura luteofluorescens TaxID=46163 RepID=A0A7Y9JEV2_9ACTN|nr:MULTISPECIES: glutathionylspermidine synthase family protein [Actinomadura]MCR3737727.1 Glutathionylspermidine synthase [Actinomadura glauciflava]NYD45831.1 glutathionylspermidine synthase [Actinomadura luteofluorescens]